MFSNIVKKDILFKTANVCVLKPHIKKGVVLFHRFYNENMDLVGVIKKDGLKSGKILHQEGVDFGRSISHNCMFFKAPYVSPKEINYSSVYTELTSIYPNLFDSKHIIESMLENYAIVRVDPTQTYVFSSEIRALYYGDEKTKLLNQSRVTLTDYFDIIEKNGYPNYQGINKPIWHLINKQMYYFSNNVSLPKLFTEFPIERNCEIIIERDVLKPEELVDII